MKINQGVGGMGSTSCVKRRTSVLHAINAAAEDDVASHAAAAAAAAALDFSCSSAAATACENWHKWSGNVTHSVIVLGVPVQMLQ